MNRGLNKTLKSVTRNSVTLSLSRNSAVQRILAHLSQEIEYLQGVGAGAHVGQSGEQVALETVATKTEGQPTIVDVGANRGEYTALALALANPSEIHAFEPQPSCIEFLESRFDDDRVSINPLALAESPGHSEIFFDEEQSGLASLTQRNLDHKSVTLDRSQVVQVTTLADYWEENGNGPIDLLKIDVEGHELDVLSGAEPLFREGLIRSCTFEFGGCNIDTRTFVRDFFEFFESVGFEICRITPGGGLQSLSPYSETHEQFRTTNFFAADPAWLSN